MPMMKFGRIIVFLDIEWGGAMDVLVLQMTCVFHFRVCFHPLGWGESNGENVQYFQIKRGENN